MSAASEPATSFLSTLKAQSASWLTNFGPQIIESGLKSTGIIKVASPPKSNLTAAQVQSGQQGQIAGMAAPSGLPGWLWPVAALLGVVVVFFAVKRKKP